VTDLSGRGVGLDLVRARIEGLGGRLELHSRPGHGSSIVLRAPLTLATQHLFLVEIDGRRWAMPTRHLDRVVAIRTRDIVTRGDEQHVELDGHRHVWLDLRDVLRLEARPLPAELLALRVRVADRVWLLAVDDVLAEREMVVRPLGRPLQSLRAMSSAALLPDGAIAPVLDPEGIIERYLTRRPTP